MKDTIALIGLVILVGCLVWAGVEIFGNDFPDHDKACFILREDDGDLVVYEPNGEPQQVKSLDDIHSYLDRL